MKKVNATLLGALLAAGIGASSAFAQAPVDPLKGDRGERMHKMQERLKAADKDGDGKISRAEAASMPRLAKHYDEIDTNKDGFITREEMKAYREKQAANRSK